jgi:hypothetical protein
MHPSLVYALQTARLQELVHAASRPGPEREPHPIRNRETRRRRYFAHARAAYQQPLRRTRERTG